MENLGLLITDGVTGEGGNRLHRDQRQHLQQVILHHIPQCTGLLVVAATSLDADSLGNRHLDVVHVAPVPDRLEDPVSKAEYEDVLHGLFAEIVVDAEDVPLAKHQADIAVELPGGVQVTPVRLLDHQPLPGALLGTPYQARGPQLRGDRGVGVRWRGQVVQPVATGAVGRILCQEPFAQPCVGARIVEAAAHIVQPARKALPEFFLERLPGELLHALLHGSAKLLVGPIPPGEPNHGKTSRQ